MQGATNRQTSIRQTCCDELPRELVDSILAGECVAFVGAGFSAGVAPGWQQLLTGLVQQLDPPNAALAQLIAALEPGNALALEAAGQMLQDQFGDEHKFEAAVQAVVGALDLVHPQVSQRRELLLQIPFHAILTTNFDNVLAGEEPNAEVYGDLLRSHDSWWQRRDWLHAGADHSRVIKLHGDANGDPKRNKIVLARQDYRRLLYEDRRYGNFLRSLFATRTLLFLGTSFTDAYLNEVRSEVVALVGGAVRGWAILPDRSPEEAAYFKRHEGIEVVAYDTADGTHAGFDRWLQAIHAETSTVARLRRLVGGQQLVWVDAHPGNNVVGFRRLEEAGGRIILLSKPEELDRARHADAAIIITSYDMGRESEPAAFATLKAVTAWGERPPVVVFSSNTDHVRRRQAVLRRGAFEYCHGWQELFRTIEQLNRAPQP